MKKILLLVAFAAFTATAANAQWTWNLKYQGDVEVGYSIGVGNLQGDRVNIHTTHGIRFNEYLFAGLGSGVDIYTGGGTDFIIPIYVSLKGYWPVTDRLSPFLGLEIGGSKGVSSDFDLGGFLCVPQIGIAYKVGQSGNAVTFAFGYTSQAWSQSGLSLNTNAVTFKAGFQF